MFWSHQNTIGLEVEANAKLLTKDWEHSHTYILEELSKDSQPTIAIVLRKLTQVGSKVLKLVQKNPKNQLFIHALLVENLTWALDANSCRSYSSHAIRIGFLRGPSPIKLGGSLRVIHEAFINWGYECSSWFTPAILEPHSLYKHPVCWPWFYEAQPSIFRAKCCSFPSILVQPRTLNWRFFPKPKWRFASHTSWIVWLFFLSFLTLPNSYLQLRPQGV